MLYPNHYPFAIVTAGHKDQLEQTVPEKFLKLFSVVVCGDMTSENKPSPVPYQTACRLLQIEPENSVVVENAPLGVQSAFCWMLPHSSNINLFCCRPFTISRDCGKSY